MKRLVVYVTDRSFEKFCQLADKRGKTRSELLKELANVGLASQRGISRTVKVLDSMFPRRKPVDIFVEEVDNVLTYFGLPSLSRIERVGVIERNGC